MNKKFYGLLPKAPMSAVAQIGRHPAEKGKRKGASGGKLVGCSRCGRTGCTLYGSGAKRLCKKCRKEQTMKECRFCVDEFCVNAECPMRGDYCPAPNYEGVCKYEERIAKTKVYIAGKITGNPNYKAEFQAAQEELEHQGKIVLNPATLPAGMAPGDYMRICFAMIDTADQILALPSCRESNGANVELAYCDYIGKPVWIWGAKDDD